MLDTKIFIGGLPSDIKREELERLVKDYGTVASITPKAGYAFVEFEDARDAKEAVDKLHRTKQFGQNINCEFSTGKKGGRFDDDRRDDRRHDRRDDRRESRRDDRDYDRRDRDSYRREDRYDRRDTRGGGVRYSSRERTSRYGRAESTKYAIRVENLSRDVSWQDLKDEFRRYGEPSYAEAHKGHSGGGRICMKDYESYKNVMDKMQGVDLKGKAIKLFGEYEIDSRSRSRSPRRERRSSRRKSDARSRSDSRGGSRSASRDHSRHKNGFNKKNGNASRSASNKSASRSPEASP